ncbi:hydantoinase/oxoprolinase family protein [Methanotrichaceae archaeon M04Ac]|uniref:Hydantoinase/oxoprolinase family protein n=1 Tax=Candidatus Methanocrinis alkalitolerans TaxID=3033395 RepID=A0ABT5XGE3_9EURY|nr:hydantoinase/oxoprolinase family protein [Candidatus Methanocrinis alkalitolerans]MDF0593790.1 hydantoinase/oxoprolinase family protein [Candidatus Methanocrinis alkalitolerans]
MLIGIDVGGTTTDAVLIDEGKVIKTSKVPTDHDHLLECLMGALDEVVREVPTDKIERVVLSTTLITNLIAEGKADPVALIMEPGPGMNPENLALEGEVRIVRGAIDYRGREIQPLDEDQVEKAAAAISEGGYRKVAVVSKFGQRNHFHEERMREIVLRTNPEIQVEMGHQASGRLNFPRRAATTMLKAAAQDKYREFAEQIAEAVSKRNIAAPIYILKADGGTLPLETSVEHPVETIFSGPAASTMGVLALTPPDQTSVVVDIGGTTTDLALILNGVPLISSEGARVDSQLTHIRAFAVKSVALGGDSRVRAAGDEVTLGPERAGPAFCLGGPEPTPTDAMRLLNLISIGERALAEEAMENLGRDLGCSAGEAAQKVVDAAVEILIGEIEAIFLAWELEPAYRVWEILQKEKIRPQNVVGVGGGSLGLVPLVAERLGAEGIIPEDAAVANAIGAAVARPTLTLTFRADTDRGFYTVAEDGTTGEIRDKKFGQKEAEALAKRLIVERAERMGISEYASEAEVTSSEVFNMVRGWSTSGRILDVSMQIPAGLIPEWTGGGRR